MFNKYDHYIKEPDLVNSNNERIDFLKLKDYDFFDQKNLISSIFTTYNDLTLK
ncbi:MAG: hypothetical protein U9Q66_02470 [Patescibacteria group bacterium]|nr:hypothetical protein [Patescibacteria group bacterium]